MVTDELIGLPAELRKAAKTTAQILHEHHIAEESLQELLESEVWLPAGLVAKEMQRIKEKILSIVNLPHATPGINKWFKEKVEGVFK